MAGIRFKATTGRLVGRQTLENSILAAARPTVVFAAHRTGERAIDNVVRNASAFFGDGSDRGRPGTPSAERGIGSIKDKGSYQYRVVATAQNLGVTLAFSIWSAGRFGAKFGALNHGSGPHAIGRPRGGFWLHPGTHGEQFYEDGIVEALDDFFSFL